MRAYMVSPTYDAVIEKMIEHPEITSDSDGRLVFTAKQFVKFITSMVQEEAELSLIPEGLRPTVNLFHFNADLSCQLQTHTPKDPIQPPSWFRDLDDDQRMQVVNYLRSRPIGMDHREVLNWYETDVDGIFRIERTINTPVDSR